MLSRIHVAAVLFGLVLAGPAAALDPRHQAAPVDIDALTAESDFTVFMHKDVSEDVRRAALGIKMRYTNPTTGDYAMPTMGTFIQLLPKGFKTSRYRSTDATVFVAVEGTGRTQIDDQLLEWGANDIFVVPSWKPVVHQAVER
jgi:mannose-6-phosphate isomerase-like protein (cupin superfamily)